MEEKVWLTQAPGCGVIEKTSTYERGTYYFFDAQNWRKVAKEFHLDYSKLENQPSIPATLSPFHATWPDRTGDSVKYLYIIYYTYVIIPCLAPHSSRFCIILFATCKNHWKRKCRNEKGGVESVCNLHWKISFISH